MIYHHIAQITVTIFLILSTYLTITKKYLSLLSLFILGIGVGGLNVYWGTLWFPYKVVLFFIFIILLIEHNRFRFSNYYNILVFVFVICTIIALFNQPKTEMSTVPLLQRSSLRPFVQLFSYLLIASLIPFIIKVLHSRDTIHNFLKNYYFIVEIIMLIALIQFILQRFGLDFIPILRPNVIDSPTAAFEMQNYLIIRLYGVTGEPKSLAAFIFPYFFVSLYNFYSKNYNRNSIYHLIMLFLSLFIIINAFSSAVLISLSLGLMLLAFTWFRTRIKILLYLTLLLLGLQLIPANYFTLAWSSSNSALPISLYDVILERTLIRVESTIAETFEYRAINFLFKENPHLILTGIGMGMYPYYITDYGMHGIDPIDSGWVAILMDLGLIGIVILLNYLLKMYKIARKKDLKKDNLFNSAFVGLCSAYLLGLGVGSFLYMMLFLSLCLAVYNVHLREKSNRI